MPAAARKGDLGSCPMIDPVDKTPHVTTTIDEGCDAVMIGGKPAALKGVSCRCRGGPPNAVQSGSATVFINGKPAVRVGDATTHGGSIQAGCDSVEIG